MACRTRSRTRRHYGNCIRISVSVFYDCTFHAIGNLRMRSDDEEENDFEEEDEDEDVSAWCLGWAC